MRILLSNDDGVHAPGLRALADSMRTLTDDITVVAPDRNRSGASNSLTINSPLRIRELDNGFLSVDGTPTDCVHLAVTGYLDQLPDIVVSGVNDTANLGDDVWYSGTVAAAMEGRFLGLPAIAMSLCGDKHFNTAAQVAKLLVQRLLRDPLPAATILNVNVPDVPYAELQGFEVTRLGTRHIAEPLIQEKDPRGEMIYWIGPPGKEQDAGEGTDFYAVERRHVSLTPLNVDITHYACFDQLSDWAKGLNP